MSDWEGMRNEGGRRESEGDRRRQTRQKGRSQGCNYGEYSHKEKPDILPTCDINSYCDAIKSGGPVDQPSICGITTLGHNAPKSWYKTSFNYLWALSYSTLRCKYENNSLKQSVRARSRPSYHYYILDYIGNSPKRI